uniref:Uncharacterized protein n=1 Tax=Arundo donax TaxID=35708 RepID=A0A0A9EJD1_ARUDO
MRMKRRPSMTRIIYMTQCLAGAGPGRVDAGGASPICLLDFTVSSQRRRKQADSEYFLPEINVA